MFWYFASSSSSSVLFLHAHWFDTGQVIKTFFLAYAVVCAAHDDSTLAILLRMPSTCLTALIRIGQKPFL